MRGKGGRGKKGKGGKIKNRRPLRPEFKRGRKDPSTIFRRKMEIESSKSIEQEQASSESKGLELREIEKLTDIGKLVGIPRSNLVIQIHRRGIADVPQIARLINPKTGKFRHKERLEEAQAKTLEEVGNAFASTARRVTRAAQTFADAMNCTIDHVNDTMSQIANLPQLTDDAINGGLQVVPIQFDDSVIRQAVLHPQHPQISVSGRSLYRCPSCTRYQSYESGEDCEDCRTADFVADPFS